MCEDGTSCVDWRVVWPAACFKTSSFSIVPITKYTHLIKPTKAASPTPLSHQKLSISLYPPSCPQQQISSTCCTPTQLIGTPQQTTIFYPPEPTTSHTLTILTRTSLFTNVEPIRPTAYTFNRRKLLRSTPNALTCLKRYVARTWAVMSFASNNAGVKTAS
jgi:hypothetical protein